MKIRIEGQLYGKNHAKIANAYVKESVDVLYDIWSTIHELIIEHREREDAKEIDSPVNQIERKYDFVLNRLRSVEGLLEDIQILLPEN